MMPISLSERSTLRGAEMAAAGAVGLAGQTASGLIGVMFSNVDNKVDNGKA